MKNSLATVLHRARQGASNSEFGMRNRLAGASFGRSRGSPASGYSLTTVCHRA